MEWEGYGGVSGVIVSSQVGGGGGGITHKKNTRIIRLAPL